MVKVKPISEAKTNYKSAAAFVPARYEAGVKRATGVIEAAIKGQALYEAKMSDPAVLARRAKALARISDEEWRRMALEKGKARIGTGMALGADKWEKEWRPYAEALSALELPERTVDPMANIDNRLKAVVSALIEKKKEIKG